MIKWKYSISDLPVNIKPCHLYRLFFIEVFVFLTYCDKIFEKKKNHEKIVKMNVFHDKTCLCKDNINDIPNSNVNAFTLKMAFLWCHILLILIGWNLHTTLGMLACDCLMEISQTQSGNHASSRSAFIQLVSNWVCACTKKKCHYNKHQGTIITVMKLKNIKCIPIKPEKITVKSGV